MLRYDYNKFIYIANVWLKDKYKYKYTKVIKLYNSLKYREKYFMINKYT
nr:hypothetical protein CPBEC1_23630 [Clostridium perfringens]